MASKTDPAKLARQPRDLIEEFNRVLLDDAKDLSAPALSEATQALKVVGRPTPAGVRADRRRPGVLAANDKVTVVPSRDPKREVAATAAELRAVAADSEQLTKSLANPASALFLMGGR